MDRRFIVSAADEEQPRKRKRLTEEEWMRESDKTLRQACKDRQLAFGGNKQAKVRRLVEHVDSEEEDEEAADALASDVDEDGNVKDLIDDSDTGAQPARL